MKLEDQMASARRRADLHYKSGFRKASKPESLLLGAGAYDGITESGDKKYDDLYKHGSRGWNYAAIRPIVARIAGRQMLAGKEVSPTDRRALMSWQKSRLPLYLKQSLRGLMPVHSHRLVELFKNPNPDMTEFLLKAVLVGNLQITGEGYLWFAGDGEDLRVWPVPSDCIQWNSEKGKWKININGKDEDWAEPSRVLCVVLPNFKNPTSGLSPLEAGLRPTIVDDSIHESQHAGFANDNMPKLAFVVGEQVRLDNTKYRPKIVKEQREELETRLSQLYGGPTKKGKSIILDGLIENVIKLSHTQQEMDYLSSSQATKKEIFQTHGVNPIITGEIEDANRASAVIADEVFCTNVINPILTLLGQSLTKFIRDTDLFPGTERDVIYFEEEEVNDPEEKRRRYQFAYQHGMVNDDEFRQELLGLGPKPNGTGQIARINGNLVELPVESSRVVKSKRMRKPTSMKQASVDWLKIHGAAEQSFASDVENVLRSQLHFVLKLIRDGEPVETLLAEEHFVTQLKSVAYGHVLSIVKDGAAMESNIVKRGSFVAKDLASELLFGLPSGVEQEYHIYVDDLLARDYWGNMNRDVVDEVNAILHGNATDLTPDTVGSMIAQKLDPRWRAMRIARTETTGALNAGNMIIRERLAEDGIITGSEWSTVIDDHTRGAKGGQWNHIDVDGVVVSVGEMFMVSGEPTPHPGHPSMSAANRIHCRCTTFSTSLFD